MHNRQGLPRWRRTSITLLLFALFTVLACLLFLTPDVAVRQHYDTPLRLVVSQNQPIKPKPNDDLEPQGGTGPCSSRRCATAARAVAAKLDPAVDPCTNPYLYSCGGWLKTFELPPEEATWSASFGTLINETRFTLRRLLETAPTPGTDDGWDAMLLQYYQTCMDLDALESKGVSHLLEKLHPDVPFALSYMADPIEAAARDASVVRAIAETLNVSQTVARGQVLSQRLAQIYQTAELPLFLEIEVETSVRDAQGRYGYYVTQTGLGLAYRQYEKPQIVQHWREYLQSIIEMFYEDLSGTSLSVAEVKRRAEVVIGIELDLKSVFATPEERRDDVKRTNLKDWKDVETRLGSAIDTSLLLENLMEGSGSAATMSELGQNVIVDDPEYYQRLATFLTEKWTWEDIQTFLVTRLIADLAPLTATRYREAKETLAQHLTGAQPPPRWKQCVDSAGSRLGWLLGRRYVRSMSAGVRRVAIAQQLVTDLRDAFEGLLRSLKWMDTPTKLKALHKLESMSEKLGYPPWIIDDYDTYFSRYYGPPNLTAMGDLIDARTHLTRRALNYSWSRFGQKKDLTEWHMYPQTVNAYYDPTANEIVFPLSIFQAPFLYPWEECPAADDEDACEGPTDIPLLKALTYGGLGTIIGHEMTHGFDDQGRHYDSEGTINDWWTPESAAAFDSLTECFRKQYGAYGLRLQKSASTYNEDGQREVMYLSSNLTMGENIADNGGIKIAYMALKHTSPDYFTHDRVLIPDTFTDMNISRGIEAVYSLAFSQTWCNQSREKTLLTRISTDPHSPGHFRSIGTLRNSAAFHEGFQCPTRDRERKGRIPTSSLEVEVEPGSDLASIIFNNKPSNMIAPMHQPICELW